ncbi:MAG: hypothetical protein H6840_01210 [Planctomycetes bacterium]|nr:hypothetical protein [Planctomycetota bacterium]
MQASNTHGGVTEPANRGLRLLSACWLCLFLAACATTPNPPSEPSPLIDRTAESNYDLEAVAAKLSQARGFERDGKRSLASAVVDTAVSMLPERYERERLYLQTIKATIWARDGQDRDSDAARALLDYVSSKAAGDGRLLGDVHLARVVLRLGDGDKVGAARAGDDALRAFSGAEAHARSIEAARDLAFQFLQADDPAAARSFARRAERDALRLDDDLLLVRTCLDVGRIEAHTGGDPEACLTTAYEAAYRLNDLGWRNVVIALAVDMYSDRKDDRACVLWGDRLRDYDEGMLPACMDSGLYPEDYITLMAQYAFAMEAVDQAGLRGQEARRLALAAISSLPDDQRAEWSGLEEKLSSGLLNPGGKK